LAKVVVVYERRYSDMGFLPGFLSINIKPNRQSESTIKESASLFNDARSSIRIVAGRLDANFYHDDRIIRALNNAASKGASIDIAYYPHREEGDFNKQLGAKIPKAHIITLKHKPPRHWAVIDGKHVRIERKHNDGATETPAIICKNVRVLADEYISSFEALSK
jgi:hypothetical protein